MAAVIAHQRTLTLIDHARLTRLADSPSVAGTSALLEDLLLQSELVASPAVPADVVTMYSQVVVADEAKGDRTTYAVCYPADAEPSSGFISVLAPMGSALLGLRVGDIARWNGPGGEPHAVRVAEMLFQPEASGDYTT